jgi:hypothetical protein
MYIPKNAFQSKPFQAITSKAGNYGGVPDLYQVTFFVHLRFCQKVFGHTFIKEFRTKFAQTQRTIIGKNCCTQQGYLMLGLADRWSSCS